MDYMEEVEMLCDKIYIMDQGKIIAHGTKEELKELVSDNQTIELKTNLLTENFEKNLKEQFPQATFRIDEEILTISMSKSEEPLANIFAIAAASNVVITSAIVKVPSLEDVFLHLTGKALRD